MPALTAIRAAALEGVRLLRDATAALLGTLGAHPDAGMAVSVPYLKLCGYVIGGWLLAKSAALAAGKRPGRSASSTPPRSTPPPSTPRRCCRLAAALARVVQSGGASVVDTDAALI